MHPIDSVRGDCSRWGAWTFKIYKRKSEFVNEDWVKCTVHQRRHLEGLNVIRSGTRSQWRLMSESVMRSQLPCVVDRSTTETV